MILTSPMGLFHINGNNTNIIRLILEDKFSLGLFCHFGPMLDMGEDFNYLLRNLELKF